MSLFIYLFYGIVFKPLRYNVNNIKGFTLYCDKEREAEDKRLTESLSHLT